MQTRHIEAIIFSIKAEVSAVVAALCYEDFGLPGAGWAAISAVLVLQPTLHSSLKASLVRVAANLAGAFGGAIVSAVIGHTLLALAVGVMLTGLACYLLKAEDAMRPRSPRWSSSFSPVTATHGTVHWIGSLPWSSAARAPWQSDFYSTNCPAFSISRKGMKIKNPATNDFQIPRFARQSKTAPTA
jgi:hypothetical protein